MPDAIERPPASADRRRALVRGASRLGRGCVLLALDGSTLPSGGCRARAGERRDGQLEAYCLRLPSAGRSSADSGLDPAGPSALVALMPAGGDPTRPLGDLELEQDGAAISISGAELEDAMGDLATLARRSLAPLDRDTRAEILSFLSGVAAGTEGDIATNEALHTLREALRERLPLNAITEESSQALDIELIVSIDDRSFYVAGRMRDERAEVVRLTAVSPEGARAELIGRLFAHRRAHAVQPRDGRRHGSGTTGFVCFFELPAPSLLAGGWIFEVENSLGTASEFEAPPVISKTSSVRDALLDDPVRDRLPNDELMNQHVHPAISRIQKQIAERVEIRSVVQFGAPPEAPEISVVVPLYRRIDLLEIQLAELVRDRELFSADLVYVLDSPEQADQLADLAANLSPIYPLPFRIAILKQNVGFAGANNAGVSLARGRLLVLMNSDVLPAVPGWLSRLAAFYDATPGIGALGPKLLYEDDTIQHAGMYFHQPPGSSAWLDAHYFRGLNRHFPAANEARPVPTVSGACLTIARDLYRELDGLRGIYVRGDYEDTDLCLRLREMGRENWYLPSVELYHLEAQSYSPSLRMPANRYNMWLHTQLWRGEIEAIVNQPEAGHRPAGEPARA